MADIYLIYLHVQVNGKLRYRSNVFVHKHMREGIDIMHLCACAMITIAHAYTTQTFNMAKNTVTSHDDL